MKSRFETEGQGNSEMAYSSVPTDLQTWTDKAIFKTYISFLTQRENDN